MKLNLLVVTDHTTHAESNSVYHLSRALADDPRCNRVWVCSKGLIQNNDFFRSYPGADIYASPVSEDFDYTTRNHYFGNFCERLDRHQIDAILIRLPQPLDATFLLSLENIVSPSKILNNPAGTIETSTKAFLLELSHLCPEMAMCNHLDEALALSQKKEIVLKPLYSYGGRGIVRLSSEHCWSENDRYPVSQLSSILKEETFSMMSFSFLKNVTQGDRRTIVVNKEILGSALRLPAPGCWMCNIAQGGHAMLSQADEDELNIESQLTPMLYRKGIVIYGFDTLVNDDGRRVLSEINSLSIGGLFPLQEMSGKPVLRKAATLLMDYLQVS